MCLLPLLELLSCKCSRSCKNPTCPCLANGLRCTELCKLTTCSNQAQEEVLDEDSEDDDDDDDINDHDDDIDDVWS